MFAAAEAKAAGYGGIAAASRATGIAVSTINRALKELADGLELVAGQIRRPGGGRKPLVESDAGLMQALLALIEPSTRGDPESPLRWTYKSVRQLATELSAQGHPISRTVVCELLHELNFSLQANCKTREGDSHPDRDAQFCYINDLVKTALIGQQPVISVDTKKKELVGDFKNGGRQWRPKGQPEAVRVHDFLIKELGRAVPYGIYDLAADHGWVSVGMDHDTAAFAVQTIRRWWQDVGRLRYPDAKKLMITADGGGSNGSRLRLWKRELQRLANELGIDITISHFPPGTSKWNKIEHRLFSFISMNWRGQPLVSYEAVVNLIGSTRTRSGLEVKAMLDTRTYEKGQKVSSQQIEQLSLQGHSFHPDWNYTLSPRMKER